MNRKAVLAGIVASIALLGGTAALAQSGRTNMYNKNGVKFGITTANFTNTYDLGGDFTVKYNGRVVGTWLQHSDGVNAQFFLALGKNEATGGRNDMVVYTGDYVVSTGECTMRRISADANSGITGTCTITPNS
ncbi:hypothetical protein [Citromicrobium bathyomarinum]|uniref:hypothetical protein n=1 Tax=Citromicrobium bathyomarinum TaxID=72174 RepID=UPI00315B31C3